MPYEDFDDILETLDDEEHREDWEDEWVCPSCEYGPMHGDLEKCDRCGCKKDCLLYTSPSPRDRG